MTSRAPASSIQQRRLDCINNVSGWVVRYEDGLSSVTGQGDISLLGQGFGIDFRRWKEDPSCKNTQPSDESARGLSSMAESHRRRACNRDSTASSSPSRSKVSGMYRWCGDMTTVSGSACDVLAMDWPRRTFSLPFDDTFSRSSMSFSFLRSAGIHQYTGYAR